MGFGLGRMIENKMLSLTHQFDLFQASLFDFCQKVELLATGQENRVIQDLARHIPVD